MLLVLDQFLEGNDGLLRLNLIGKIWPVSSPKTKRFRRMAVCGSDDSSEYGGTSSNIDRQQLTVVMFGVHLTLD